MGKRKPDVDVSDGDGEIPGPSTQPVASTPVYERNNGKIEIKHTQK